MHIDTRPAAAPTASSHRPFPQRRHALGPVWDGDWGQACYGDQQNRQPEDGWESTLSEQPTHQLINCALSIRIRGVFPSVSGSLARAAPRRQSSAQPTPPKAG